ncbi:hypothetical protein IAR50_006993 [Cryptococcus sp. DSM 104548]
MNEDSDQQQERPPPRRSKRPKIGQKIQAPPDPSHPPPQASVASTEPGANQSQQEENPAQRRSARLHNSHLPTSDQIPSTSQATATNNNCGATSQTTQPAQDLQITGTLDEHVLHRFHKYVIESRKTARVPIDAGLQEWGNVPLGQFLKLKYQEPLSFDEEEIPYDELRRLMMSRNNGFNRMHESALREELFTSRRPKVIRRRNLPEELADLEKAFPPDPKIAFDIEANLLQRHSPFSPPIQETKSFSANLLYLGAKQLKKHGDIAEALKFVREGKITKPDTLSSEQEESPEHPEGRVDALAGAALEGSVTSPRKAQSKASKASSAAGVVETDLSYTVCWPSSLAFEVLSAYSEEYHGVLIVVEVKTLRINVEVEVTDEESEARSQYEKGLSQVIKYLHHAWEKFGTRSGLFVCGPFFARLAVIDDQGNIAVECKLPASVGSEYYNSQENNHDSPGSFFRVFDLQTLPHSLLVPYSSDPELAKRLSVKTPSPLLCMDSLQRFEHMIQHTLEAALNMTVAQALGQRPEFPFANQIQYDDSPMPTAEDLKAGNSAHIDKAGTRSPILWYLSARRDAKERISDKDVVKFLRLFDEHVNMEDVGIESHGEGNGRNGGQGSAKEGDPKDSHEKKGKGGKGGVSGGNGTGRDGNSFQGRSADKHQEGGDDVRESDGETLSDKVNAWASRSALPESAPPPSPSMPPSTSPLVHDFEEKLDDAFAFETDWYEESGVLPPSSFAVKAASVTFMDTFFCYYPLTQIRRESL